MQEDMEGFKSVGEGTETTELEEPITPAGMEGGERIMVGEEKKKAGDGVVVALPGEDKVVEVVKGQEEKNMKRTGREDKAARIERLKSGFRICKPQGTFLWPNTMSLLLSNSSPSPQFAVEDLVLVPTPTPLPSSPPSHRSRHHHHLLQSPTPTSDGGVSSAALLPASPVKPLAEKRTLPLATAVPLVPETAMPPIHSAATKATKQTPSMSHPASPATEGALIAIESVSPRAKKPSASSLVKHESAQANATLVINLNELPNNTSSASSLTYKRRYHNATIASSSSSAIISSSVVEVAVKQWEEGDDIIQQLKKQKKAQQQQGSCSPSLPSSSRDCLFEGGGGPSPSPSSWLALATTTPHASSSSDSLAPPTDGLI